MSVTFRDRGAYSPYVAYEPGDRVTDGQFEYLAVKPSKGIKTQYSHWWMRLGRVRRFRG